MQILPGLAWSKAILCDVLSVPRSSFYYQSQKLDDQPLKAAIQRVAGEWPRYGSERITAQRKREGVTFQEKFVGERRTRRLMREMGLLAKPHPRKPRTTSSDPPFPRYLNLVKGQVVTQSDQVWVSDITYIRLGQSFVYLAVIMDVYTRSIRGWFLSRRLDGDLTLFALKRVLENNTRQIHHSVHRCVSTIRASSTLPKTTLLCRKAEESPFRWRQWAVLKKTASQRGSVTD